jgi:hypothetical protein
MARELSLKRSVDGVRCVGCRGGGCLLQMGPPGTVDATSTARLEDLSVQQVTPQRVAAPLVSEVPVEAWLAADPNGGDHAHSTAVMRQRHVERVIGSLLRECTDEIIPMGESHLQRTMREYAECYSDDRPAPVSRTTTDAPA